MGTIKTIVNDANVEDFINQVDNDLKRQDSFKLLKLYQRLTGEAPKMWGASIIGFGQYHYKSTKSRQEGDWPLTGFSPRAQNLTLYFMDGFANYAPQLAKLGKHKISKSCLYINKLADVDLKVLEKLIEQSYLDMKHKHQ